MTSVTKLKALVEEWRWNARNERIGWPEAAGLLYAADRLEDAILNSPEIPDGCAALLAESEPDIPTEPCEQFKPCAMSGKRGHPAELCGSTCETCGFAADRHEAKAKLPLPLGHEFVPHTNGPERDCTLYQKCHYIGGPGLCGQPRSAHEPR